MIYRHYSVAVSCAVNKLLALPQGHVKVAVHTPCILWWGCGAAGCPLGVAPAPPPLGRFEGGHPEGTRARPNLPKNDFDMALASASPARDIQSRLQSNC